MPVEISKNAGFCYGVKAAVEMAQQETKGGSPCWVLGSLIHNEQVMQQLCDAGLKVAQTMDEITEGTLIVRSHGMSKAALESLEARGIRIADATCRDVKRVHKLVQSYSIDGSPVIIAGSAKHPEVQATAGWCAGPVLFVEDANAAHRIVGCQRALLVAQTTLKDSIWQEIVHILKQSIPSLTIANTMCRATINRQREAEVLAEKADVVLVVGGRESANTHALYETCRARCVRTFYLESVADIPANGIKASDYIVIAAGASTPDWSLKEVATRMNDLEQNSSQEALEPVATPVEGTPTAEATIEPTPSPEAGVSPEEETAACTLGADVPEKAEPKVEYITEDKLNETEQKPAEEPAVSKAPRGEAAENSFLADIEATLVTIRPGQTITGTVVQITEDEVCVNIGYKSDGLVKRSDLVTTDVQVNDKIEVEVVKVNDGEGNVVLSQRNIVNRRNWDALMKQFEAEEYVDGIGKEAVKGGLIANVNGIRAFIPASQLSQRYVEKIEDFVGKEMKLKIIEVDKAKKRIVCSRKQVIAEETTARKKEIWDKLHEGEVVEGVVRRLTDFGAFVDIGGVDGLIHVTDLSWGRVKHPNEVVSPNQHINVKILSLDQERERIQLGYKQIQPRPWDIAEEKFPVNSIVEGKVVRITTFGAFVELEPGLDGLVHISQCALTRIAKVEDAVQVGQVLRVKVLGVDTQAKRISLSIRAALEEEALNYSSEIPGEDFGMGDGFGEDYATPVVYQTAAESVETEQPATEAAPEPEAEA